MARRYTITDVTDPGSSVAKFRTAISGSITAGSANKGYSDDTRMRNMFPKSPLYSSGSNNDYHNDGLIITKFKNQVIDTDTQQNYDFTGTDIAYMNFTHPNSPDIDMNKLNNPIDDAEINGGSTNNKDKPYYGHPNLQVNSVDPFDQRTVVETGLLRERTAQDGGFGRKYKTNYATSKNDDGTLDTTSTIPNIGKYFSKIYNSTDATINADSKKNMLGSSRATSSGGNGNTTQSVDDKGNPL